MSAGHSLVAGSLFTVFEKEQRKGVCGEDGDKVDTLYEALLCQ